MTNIPITNQLLSNIERAKKFALNIGRNGVSPDLILYSLLAFPSLGASNIFRHCGLDVEGMQSAVADELNAKKPSSSPSDHIVTSTKKLFGISERLSVDSFGLDYLAPEVLFLCFFSEDFAPKSLKKFFGQKTMDDVTSLEIIQKLFESTALYLRDFDFSIEEEEQEKFISDEKAEGNLSENYLDMFEENKVLSQFAENLNLKAARGHFENMVDFDNKIDELTAILCRKKKPNAILVGEAGTGKSMLVSDLALKIVRGEAPELLANKVIYSLNLSGMVAGTMYRGQFEERLKNFVDEIKKYNNIILFIDEIHTLMGAGGGSSSSLEASNILKPELARGTISCIGATTINECTATIKKDSALDRRFERVIIRQPSKFVMKQILPEIVSHYEDFHGVKYSQEFTDNVVDYCERFLPNRFYPDKAVTVIDHCGAQAKVNFWQTDDSVKESQQRILAKIDEFGDVPPELFEELNKKLESWQERVMAEEPEVNLLHLKDFFEKRMNPLASLEICKDVSSFLKSEFVGQKSAIKDFFNTLTKNTMGLGKKNSPSSPDSYLFYGGKSVGKTLFSKTLQDALEKSGASVIYYSGIQLADQLAQYKILSDYGRNTTLCEKVVMSPNCVIIIDDFDELHFSCVDLFSQILKEGKLQMSNGDMADFSNCKFIFTCGTNQSSSMGFNAEKQSGTPKLNKKLESLLEASFYLSNPSKRDLRRIVCNKLRNLKNNLKFQNIDLLFDFKFINNFVKRNQCEENCVEAINKAVEKDIIGEVSVKVLAGDKSIML